MPRKLTPDLWLFAVVVGLVSVGVVMVYSASAIVAAERFHDPFFFLRKQLFWAVAGFGCLWIAMRLDYRRLERFVTPLLVVSFALLVLVSGSPERLEKARREVERLCGELELLAQWKNTRIAPPAPAYTSGQQLIPYQVTAVALDQPGIVHKIARLLAQKGVNVADLETRLSHAADSGAPLFSLELVAQVPAGARAISLAMLVTISIGRVIRCENR